MSKIISFEEYQALWKRDKQKALTQFDEQYEVRFQYQKEDGFWAKDSKIFCSSGKDDHEDVAKEVQKRFRKAEIISVRYQ